VPLLGFRHALKDCPFFGISLALRERAVVPGAEHLIAPREPEARYELLVFVH
jgi:hypothetical protein